jgi:hypothetical protein
MTPRAGSGPAKGLRASSRPQLFSGGQLPLLGLRGGRGLSAPPHLVAANGYYRRDTFQKRACNGPNSACWLLVTASPRPPSRCHQRLTFLSYSTYMCSLCNYTGHLLCLQNAYAILALLYRLQCGTKSEYVPGHYYVTFYDGTQVPTWSPHRSVGFLMSVVCITVRIINLA